MSRTSRIKRSNLLVLTVVLAIGGVTPALTMRATAAGLSLDKTVVTHQSAASTAITSATVSTAQPNELLVAFLASDGPSGANSQSFSSISGGGLTWTLRKRTNTQPGTAEIWTAPAPAMLTNVTFKATRAGGSAQGDMVVAAFIGASTTAIGAVGGGSASTGAPSASLATTTAGSWVWGTGDDYTNAVQRTVGAGQTLVDQYLSPSRDTYWTQNQTAVTPVAGTVVTLNDTAPMNDRWDLSLIEILPATIDATAPTVPTNLIATAASTTQVNLGWTASTDNVGVAGYTVLRGDTPIATTSATAYNDAGLTANTNYMYTVQAFDAAGNVSAASAPATATTLVSSDTTAPTVQVTAPSNGSTISGVTTVTAGASDNTSVASVQFLLDGANLGNALTSAPYTFNWNTTIVANGTHTLSALAYDGAGNVGTAANVTLTINNPVGVAPTVDPSTPAAVAVKNNVLTTTSPSFSPPASTVIYAVFSMDSASYNGNITTVASFTNTGTPLTWHLLGRNNNYSSTTGGFVEVWWAYNASAQSDVTTTATFSQNTKNVTPPVGDFQIIVMDNAAPDQSAAAWNANWLVDSENNAPNVSVATTRANSQVFAVFDNWNNGQTPVAGDGQTINSIVLNTTDVDGYWIQQENVPTAIAGTTVTLNATDPGRTTQWRGIAWEVLATN